MILVLDNYDSFVFNLARYVNELGYESQVLRNDEVSLDDIVYKLKPSHIIISPGPCTPNEAGISVPLLQQMRWQCPILGICLGHQAIGQAFGGIITRAKRPMHGMASSIRHNHQGLFENIANPFQGARYHSLVVSPLDLPPQLKVTAHSEEGEIMALQHVDLPIFGLQFHPESILTDCGYELIGRFLQYS